MTEALKRRLIREITASSIKRTLVFDPIEVAFVKGCDRFKIVDMTPEGYVYVVCKEEAMKTLESMTRDEKNLLLYLETCCVDYGGAYEQRRINDIDREIMNQWEEEGFITKGRISSSTWPTGEKCWWINLSLDAWAIAHEERLARFERMNESRNWKKLEEVSA